MNTGARGAPRPRVRFGSAWFWLAAALATDRASAGDNVHGGTTAIAARFDSPYGGSLRRGYQPIFVSLSNQSPTTRRVELLVSGEYWKDHPFRVGDEIELAPGESVDRELVVPVPFDQSFTLSLGDGEKFWRRGIQVGVAENDDRTAIAAFGSTDETARRRIDAALDAAGVESYSKLAVERMPTRLASFTALDVVVLDLSSEAVDPTRLDGLLAWTRTGGTLYLVGRDRDEIVTLFPVFAPYLPDAGAATDSEPPAGSTRHAFPCGFGRLLVGPTLAPDDSAAPIPELVAELERLERNHYSRAADARWEDREKLLPMTGRAVPRFAPEEIPTLEPPVDALPARGALVAILFVFTMAIGPLSFFLARSRRLPILTLVLTPSFAILGVVVVFAAAVIGRGLGVKTRCLTFTYLDQRVHRATTIEARAMHCGLAESFRLDGTFGACIADHDPTRFLHFSDFPFGRRRNDLGGGATLELQQSAGLIHSGGFAPPRRVVRQLLLLDRAARGRIELKYEDRAEGRILIATNALDRPLRSLLVRTGEYDHHVLAEDALAPGASAPLRRLSHEAAERCADVANAYLDSVIPTRNVSRAERKLFTGISQWLIAAGRELAIGEFAAITDGAAFPVHDDLEIEEVGGAHVILGAFDPVDLGAPR